MGGQQAWRITGEKCQRDAYRIAYCNLFALLSGVR
jgi:hypothetical protein